MESSPGPPELGSPKEGFACDSVSTLTRGRCLSGEGLSQGNGCQSRVCVNRKKEGCCLYSLADEVF